MGAGINTVLLASFPKSGRTWLRFMLANYMNLVFGIGDVIDLRTVYRFVPSLAGGEDTGFGAYLRYEGRFPLIVCTHTSYDERFAGRKIVLLKRDFYDMFVSYYHRVHNAASAARFNGGLSEFVEAFPWEFAAGFFNTWSERALLASDDVLVVSYESMHQDVEHVLTEVLQAAAVEVVPNMVTQAALAGRFETMHASENMQLDPGYNEQYDRSVPNGRHVRAGKIGAGAKELSAKDRQAILTRCVARFSPVARMFLGL